MNESRKLADQLIKSLEDSEAASLSAIGTQRENFFEEVTNRRAARGTLYSSGTDFEQTRGDAMQFRPAEADARRKTLMGTIGIRQDLLNTKRQIDSLNAAAKDLSKNNRAYFESLLI